MLLYITLGSNDLARARRFYDAVMPTIGAIVPAAVGVDIGCGMIDRGAAFPVA